MKMRRIGNPFPESAVRFCVNRYLIGCVWLPLLGGDHATLDSGRTLAPLGSKQLEDFIVVMFSCQFSDACYEHVGVTHHLSTVGWQPKVHRFRGAALPADV